MNKIYIHYGHSSFDPSKFIDVRDNTEYLCDGRKPHSGLWGTWVDSNYGWKEILQSDKEIFRNEGWRLGEFFTFSLQRDAKIISIHNEENFNRLLHPFFSEYKIDYTKALEAQFKIFWEKMAEQYDAIEVDAGSNTYLHMAFKGWECDSICVFHKEVIILT